jgi:hypothetical protein
MVLILPRQIGLEMKTTMPRLFSKRWRRTSGRVLLVYLSIGLFLSCAQNVQGLVTGDPTAFAWTGSLRDNIIILFWWFLVPIVTWPIDVFWTTYHLIV